MVPVFQCLWAGFRLSFRQGFPCLALTTFACTPLSPVRCNASMEARHLCDQRWLRAISELYGLCSGALYLAGNPNAFALAPWHCCHLIFCLLRDKMKLRITPC